jgi:ribokinase
VAAARLGAETAFVGAIGDDSFGVDARHALAAEGIDLRGLACLVGEATGVALILVDADGENSIAVAGGANAALSADHVRTALASLHPGPRDVVLVGHEIPAAATREALRLGREAGATTILNPAPAGGLDTATLADADILTPNRGELAILAGIAAVPVDGPTAAVAEAIRRRASVGAILVSLGPDGAILVEAGGTTVLAAPLVRVVDSTGAGDALNGAFAAGLADGLSVVEAARRAVTAASLAVARAGAREGMPGREELQAAGG